MSADFQKLVGSAELLYVGLVHSTFERAPDLATDVEDLEKFVRQEIEETPVRASDNELGGDIISCKIRCRIWVDPEKHGDDVGADESFDTALLRISASYLVAFHATDSESLSDEAVWKFCERIGIMSVWPYFRSHCSHYANEAAIHLPPLPLKKAVYPIRELPPSATFKDFSEDEKTA